jgi:hypothetical protein
MNYLYGIECGEMDSGLGLSPKAEKELSNCGAMAFGVKGMLRGFESCWDFTELVKIWGIMLWKRIEVNTRLFRFVQFLNASFRKL